MSRTLPALCLASQAFVVSQAAAQSAALGPVFEVNTYTTGSQFSPGVATDLAGNFVVVWVASGPRRSGDLRAALRQCGERGRRGISDQCRP